MTIIDLSDRKKRKCTRTHSKITNYMYRHSPVTFFINMVSDPGSTLLQVASVGADEHRDSEFRSFVRLFHYPKHTSLSPDNAIQVSFKCVRNLYPLISLAFSLYLRT